jgi:hypothetical protein
VAATGAGYDTVAAKPVVRALLAAFAELVHADGADHWVILVADPVG